MDRETLIRKAFIDERDHQILVESLGLPSPPKPLVIEKRPDTGRPILLLPTKVIPRSYGRDVILREIIEE